MIREVTMYRAECDAEGCDESPQEGGDFFAWADPGAALDEATGGDWYVTDDALLCHDHAPKCAADGCELALHDDEFGAVCEDHYDESQAQPLGASVSDEKALTSSAHTGPDIGSDR